MEQGLFILSIYPVWIDWGTVSNAGEMTDDWRDETELAVLSYSSNGKSRASEVCSAGALKGISNSWYF